MEYQIEIEEILTRTISVIANSSTDAIGKVRHQYNQSKIVLDSSDFSSVEFRQVNSIKEDK